MESSLLSVIIPVYNAKETLAECLQAIYASSYRNFEVLLIDDLSTDGSMDIARNFPCRIIILDKKSGPAAARNKGADKASGEILFFTDSDIIIRPDTLGKISKSIEGKVAITGMYSRKPHKKNFFSLYHNYYAHKSQKETSSSTFMFHTSCGAIRKKVFKELGGFNEDMKKATVEDVEFGYRLIERGYEVFLDKNLKVVHFTNYSFSKLIKSYFYKSRDWADLLFARKERLLKNEGWANYKNIAILLSALLLIPLSALSFYNLFYILPLFLCIIFFIYHNHDFYQLVFEEMPLFLITGVIFNYFMNLVLFCGISAGMFGCLRRRIYNAVHK
jgi:glycosyltransferase involved in cell wall biosynthesis